MPGISVGTQLEARNGYRNLEKGRTYYVLRSSQLTSRVLLVDFVIRPACEKVYRSAKKPKRKVTPIPYPRLVALDRENFELGLLKGEIVRLPEQRTMPPWLDKLEGLNLEIKDKPGRKRKRSLADRIGQNREAILLPVRDHEQIVYSNDLEAINNEQARTPKSKPSHKDRIDRKLDAIHPLVRDFEQVLDSDNPDEIINRHARTLNPTQNETRVRLWFYTYIVFGRNRFALHYPIHKQGHWNRLETASSIKRGRPPLNGKGYGYNTTSDTLAMMLNGYRRESGINTDLIFIYVQTMRKDFGCRTKEVKIGKRKYLEIWHPEGKPFPTSGTFAYHVNKSFKKLIVQETRLGATRVRSQLAPTRGPFTQHTLNLMQRGEGDAYAVAELARGLVEGHPLPPLYVVIRRDTASGIKTGIGFSQGSERGSAYRGAKFCEAIPKVRYCRLFGIEISEDQWPSIGGAPEEITDRGAGSTRDAKGREPDYAPTVSQMPPSYSGQSKAIIESSNPKNPSNDEAPSFVLSNLRTFELVRREIFRLLQFNDSCDIGNRIPPDLLEEVRRQTPNGLWETLDNCGRNDAVQMSFETAVRTYLDKLDATLTRDGVFLLGQRYMSKELDAAGARSSVSGNQSTEVTVYFLEGCLRYIWLEWKGRLIEVEVQYAVPVSNDVLYMSLEEVRQFDEYTRAHSQPLKKHREAVALKTYHEFKEVVGKEWNSGSRVRGRPKRGTRAAKQEAIETKAAMRGRKAA